MTASEARTLTRRDLWRSPGMTSCALYFVALPEQIARHEAAPADDPIVVLRGTGWFDCQPVLELQGDRSVRRLA